MNEPPPLPGQGAGDSAKRAGKPAPKLAMPLKPRPAPPRPGAKESEPPDSDEGQGAELTSGEMVADKYRVEELLARGGMGSVWQGWDTALDRPVAIKFMAASIARSKSLRTRFDREAKAAAKLRTPHVVEIYEHGVHRELPFMVLELLEGEDLHDRLKRVGRLPLGEVVAIVTQTARGLRRAHAKGIVHRDLKPRNIFLAKDEDEELVKILDFGIAKSVHADHDGDTTKTGQILGSPNYMSPEQARGHRAIDHRTDLWALAVIAWKCLTGQTLFSGKTSGDVIVKICTEPLPIFSSVVPGLSPALDGFFAKALARDPDERFQSASSFVEELRAVLRASDDPAARAAAGPLDDRLSGEWTPVSGITPLEGRQSSPSITASPPSEPGLTPPPLATDPGERWSSTDGSGPSGVPELAGSAASSAVGQRSPRLWMAAVAVVAVVVLAAGGLLMAGGDDESRAPAQVTTEPPPSATEHLSDGESTAPPGEAATTTADTTAAAGGHGAAEQEPASSATVEASAEPTARVVKSPRPRPPSPPRPPTTAKTAKPKGRWGY